MVGGKLVILDSRLFIDHVIAKAAREVLIPQIQQAWEQIVRIIPETAMLINRAICNIVIVGGGSQLRDIEDIFREALQPYVARPDDLGFKIPGGSLTTVADGALQYALLLEEEWPDIERLQNRWAAWNHLDVNIIQNWYDKWTRDMAQEDFRQAMKYNFPF